MIMADPLLSEEQNFIDRILKIPVTKWRSQELGFNILLIVGGLLITLSMLYLHRVVICDRTFLFCMAGLFLGILLVIAYVSLTRKKKEQQLLFSIFQKLSK
jgi:hypothetical protein